MKKAILYGLATFFVIVAVVFTGCAAPSAPTSSASAVSSPASNQTSQSAVSPAQNPTNTFGNIVSVNPTASSGKLEIKVTDAPADEVITGISVVVENIQVHKAGPGDTEEEVESESEGTPEEQSESKDNNNWLTIPVDPEDNEFDLLQVKDNPKTLALVFPEVGKYTQIRMEVGEVNITFAEGDAEHTETAIVPSGKIKFVHPFEVTEEGTTELLFDFDAGKSVNIAGNGDKIMFKPVIKLSVSQKNEEESVEAAEVSEETVDQELSIATKKLADGKVGAEYNVALEAEGGAEPYEWTVTADQLPDGLALSEDGAITGKPTAEGNYTFTVQALDSEDETATREFTLKVAAADLQITTTSLLPGEQGQAYAAEAVLEAAGGKQPYSWSITAGALPEGMSLDAETGAISGTPTVSGTFNFTVTVTDNRHPEANTDVQELTLEIAEASGT